MENFLPSYISTGESFCGNVPHNIYKGLYPYHRNSVPKLLVIQHKTSILCLQNVINNNKKT
jgi:hypothetical protein